MKLSIKNTFTILAVSFSLLAFTSCDKDDSAPQEEEYFNITVDGLSIVLTSQNAVDSNGDNSIFVSGGLHPDRYSITVVSSELRSTGTITCADNEERYSVLLSIFSGPDNDLTSYSDSDNTCQSTITISRNDSYIEGTFSSIVTESFGSNPETVFVSGSFKVREDED